MLALPYESFLYFVAASVSLAVFWYSTDINRVLLHTAYQCGYHRGQGKGVIPGPREDTRISRFSEGTRIIPEYRNKYGPLYRVFCGSIPEIVLTDPEDVRAYYLGDAKVHGKNPGMGFGHLMLRVLGHAVGLQDNERWRRLRGILDPHFSAAHAFNLLPVVVSDADAWIKTIPTLPSTIIDQKKNKLNVDIDKFVASLPFQIICRRLFGDILDDKIVEELLELNKVHERVISATFFGHFQQWWIFKYLPVKANRDVEDFEETWTKFLVRVCKMTEERGYSSSMLDLYKDVQQGKMTFLEFSHTIDEILFTNIDVTTTAVAWAVAQVGMEPDVQAKLHAEIIAALNNPELGKTREDRVEAYVVKTDTYLHYCNQESGRLRPVLYYSLPEVMSHAKVIHGYYIPPNSSVLIDAYTLNRRSPVWGNDGQVFRPERFADLSPTQYRYSFWRFGLGPRKCMGINFADKIVKAILMTVVEKYEVEVMDHWLGEEKTKFVNAPSGMMIFTPRNGMKV